MSIRNRAVPRDELQRRIYEAAIEIFRKRGFERATVEEVTRLAGVAKGTFFNFYPTKLSVLAEYYRAVDARIIALRDAMDPAAPEQALNGFAAKVEEVLRQEGPLVLDLLKVALADAGLRDIDYASGDADEAAFAAFIKTAQRLGRINAGVDPAKAAGVIVDLWSGAMRRWAHAGGVPTLAGMFSEKIHVVFQGLKGRAENAPA